MLEISYRDVAFSGYTPSVRRAFASQDVEEGSLAGTGQPYQCYTLPGREIKSEVLEQNVFPVGLTDVESTQHFNLF